MYVHWDNNTANLGTDRMIFSPDHKASIGEKIINCGKTLLMI